jgi:hypothetical protein
MGSACEEWPASSQTMPYGLMSLWDMINLHIASVCSLCSQLMFETLRREEIVRGDRDGGGPWVSGPDREKMKGWLKIGEQCAVDFEWQAVHDRIEIFSDKLSKPIPHAAFLNEVTVLRETIEKGLRGQLAYRYPAEKAKVLWNWKKDWAPVLNKFPSAESDIIAAVDLWALCHWTACVFHLMRVLEHGLKALATDVGKSFDVQNWQNIIDQIESEIRTLGKTLPAGANKGERLRFLSEAAKEFTYFKDGWRNYVSHNKANYDEYQARGALEHVKAFMTTISSRLNEPEGA